jgi:tRNA 2-selenouridine synthase
MLSVETTEFLRLAREAEEPIYDVRSPGEFAKGHIPGAINLPLFTDDQRAEIGTLYKDLGRQEAVLAGLDAAGPRLRDLADKALMTSPQGGEICVHCWRGGMRSQSVAWLLERVDLKVSVLQGGYKAYREQVRAVIGTAWPKLRIVGGLTGSGKTEILVGLRNLGEQVLDLEGLANHRGSAFGGIDRVCPNQETFENALEAEISRLDPARRVWVEDESRMIGRLALPEDLWRQKDGAPLACVEVDRERRIDRLVKEYGEHDPGDLVTSFEAIRKRLGHERTDLALRALNEADLSTACKEALAYYDSCYLYGLKKRSETTMSTFCWTDESPEELAEALVKWAEQDEK